MYMVIRINIFPSKPFLFQNILMLRWKNWQRNNANIPSIIHPAAHTLNIGFNDNHRLPGITICDKPTHSNISHSIIYEIAKTHPLRYWIEKVQTHQSTWEDIDPKCFERERDKFPTHMIHFITKCITNTLTVIKILHRCLHAT